MSLFRIAHLREAKARSSSDPSVVDQISGFICSKLVLPTAAARAGDRWVPIHRGGGFVPVWFQVTDRPAVSGIWRNPWV